MGSLQYLLMITSTLLIAGAGFVSNDYFDVITDRVNKPNKQYIGIKLKPGSALAIALLLSAFASVLAIWLSVLNQSLIPAILLILALLVTWWYAMKLKKSFVWGNLAVAFMSAGTIAMAWIIENQVSQTPYQPFSLITGIVTAISIIALLLSLIREIVKDIEDIEGDRLINCKSLPIVKGIPFTKSVVFLISCITIILLMIVQFYLWEFSKFPAIIWLFISVEIPMIYFLAALSKAEQKADFHKLSTLLKLIMVGGMASIVAGQFQV
jgi:4-hydroxybenzoate polyprenyltransferase